MPRLIKSNRKGKEYCAIQVITRSYGILEELYN